MLQNALAANPDAKAVFATLSETSTGVGHDLEAFGKLVAKTDALLVVDGISGLGAMECRMDAWNIDVCVTGSQKALMLPPGLAFVSVSEKAWKKIDATPVRELLPRPAALQEVARRERHAVHPGEHAHQGAAGEPEADPRGGHREPVGAAREDRGRVPRRREGDGAGSVRRAAEQRADGHHRAAGRRRHRHAEEAGEAVRLQARRRPGHA